MKVSIFAFFVVTHRVLLLILLFLKLKKYIIQVFFFVGFLFGHVFIVFVFGCVSVTSQHLPVLSN